MSDGAAARFSGRAGRPTRRDALQLASGYVQGRRQAAGARTVRHIAAIAPRLAIGAARLVAARPGSAWRGPWFYFARAL